MKPIGLPDFLQIKLPKGNKRTGGTGGGVAGGGYGGSSYTSW